jgi:serine/threonine protein phosphatase PrpC
LADGHGDDRHDRSRIGAALAVRAAVEELLDLLTQCGEGDGLQQLIQAFRNDFPHSVGKRWRDCVRADASRQQREGSARAQVDDAIWTRYGTTLLAAMAVGSAVVVGQIGDGTAVLVPADGEPEVLLEAGGPDASVTDSLCERGADRLWQFAVRDRPESGLLLLGTDGLANAFVDRSQLLAFARSLGQRIEEYGPARVAASLPGWLDQYSEQASGDDITLAVLVIQPESARTESPKPGTGPLDPNDGGHSEGGAHVTGDRTTGCYGAGENGVRGEEKTG